MLDSVGAAMERLIKAENSKVSSANGTTRIKKEGEDKNRSNQNFKHDLQMASKKIIEVEAEKVDEEQDIIVSSSLSEKLEEQKRIGKLVEEKFVNNPNVNNLIKLK